MKAAYTQGISYTQLAAEKGAIIQSVIINKTKHLIRSKIITNYK